MAIMIATTYHCQCNCVHCSSSGFEEKNKEELSTVEIIKAIDDACDLGILKIGFTGGEPLLRSDLPDLVNHAYKKGLSTSVDTNGILLDEKLVVNLKNAGISNINISIDDSNANIHDRLRKAYNSFTQAVLGIKHCVKHKIPCIVSTYITDSSIETGELSNIICLAKNLKATALRVLFPIYSGKFKNSKDQLLSQANKKLFFDSFVDDSFVYSESPLYDFSNRNVECSAEKKLSIYMTAYGDVKYCYVTSNGLGNVRDESLLEILKGKKYFSSKDRIKLDCQTIRNN